MRNSSTILAALEQYHYSEVPIEEEVNPIYTKGWWGWVFLTLTSLLVVWGTITGV